MTNAEAETLTPGTSIQVNALQTTVEDIGYMAGTDDVFIATPYGQFNASVCELDEREAQKGGAHE